MQISSDKIKSGDKFINLMVENNKMNCLFCVKELFFDTLVGSLIY